MSGRFPPKQEGVFSLLKAIENGLNKDRKTFKLMIPVSDGKTLATLYRKGQILSRKDHEKTITLMVRLRSEDEALFKPYICFGKKND